MSYAMTDTELKIVADALRELAGRIERERANVSVHVTRPEIRLDPLAGECPFDGFAHYRPGTVETWTVEILHEETRDSP